MCALVFSPLRCDAKWQALNPSVREKFVPHENCLASIALHTEKGREKSIFIPSCTQSGRWDFFVFAVEGNGGSRRGKEDGAWKLREILSIGLANISLKM